MKMFFKILVTRKISPCLGWVFEVVSELLDISTIINFYWWMNKLFDYMWNVTLLNIWYGRSRSKIGFISEIMWAVRFVFETTPDIFGFFCIFFFFFFFFVDLLPKKDQSKSAKICALLIFEIFYSPFCKQILYNSVDFVQLDG